MSFFFNTYPSEEIFVLFWILTPSSETRRAVGSLGLCSHPHFIHPSPHKTVFVGFLCCFRVVTFVVVCDWLRETPKEVLYFLISNTKVQSQRTMVVGSLGVSPHPHFIYLAPPKNCLVVFVLPSFHPSLSPQNCCWNCFCVVVVGAPGWSQKFVTELDKKKQTNEFFSPSFKTFRLQTETKTK